MLKAFPPRLNGHLLVLCSVLVVVVYLRSKHYKQDISSYSEIPSHFIMEEEPVLRFNTPDNLKYGAMAVGISSLAFALLVAV